MKLDVSLLAGALALLFVVAIAFTVVGVFLPSAERLYEAAHTAHTNSVFDDPDVVLQQRAADRATAVKSGLVTTVLFGMLLITVGVVLRRHPITQSWQVRGQMEVEEARIMQEIYRSLGRMEERIDALETLLLERGDLRGVERVRTFEGSGREPR